MDLRGDEKLEQRDNSPEVRVTSMLIVDESKADSHTFTCIVQHDSSFQDKSQEIKKGNIKEMICILCVSAVMCSKVPLDHDVVFLLQVTLCQTLSLFLPVHL